MAHCIGEYDFAIYGTNPAWHRTKNRDGLTHIGRTITADEAKAEIGFTVASKPLVLDGYTGPVTGYHVNYRLDMAANDPNGVVGVVGDDYTIIQNGVVVDLVDAFAKALNGGIESAFTMLNGRRVVVAAKVGAEQAIRNANGSEPFQGYVWSYSSHDGLVKATLQQASLLPVCMNTVLAALRGRSNVIKIMHTQSSVEAIRRVTEAAKGHAGYYGDMLAALSFLSDTPATGEVRQAFLDELFPAPQEPAKGAPEAVTASYERAKKAREVKVDRVLLGFEGDKGGADLPTRRGTLFGLVQAASGLAEHTPRFRVEGGREGAAKQDIEEAKLRSLFEGSTGRNIAAVYAAGMKVAAAAAS